jgi:dienelactone hydrolase
MVTIALLLAALAAAPRAQSAEAPLVVRDWLVVAPTERRARRPFIPSAAFAQILLDADAALPREGDALVGESGEKRLWTKVAADANGSVAARMNGAACVEVEWPADGLALADLDGAATLWVNGVPQAGDPYGDGMGGLPVAMKRGPNRIVVTGLRGPFRLALAPPDSELLIAPFDATRPDVVAGETTALLAALLLVNASPRALGEIVLEVEGASADSPFEPSRQTVAPGLGPRGILKVPFTLLPHAGHAAFSKPGGVDATIRVTSGALARATTLRLEVKAGDALARHTRRSAIDGSVQEYALLPPEGDAADALVLTLHGAGVDCVGQAAAYSRKKEFWICAPTNRRRFGFDWQDWGRIDAYETLADALRLTGVGPKRVFLTGHSMGGHGTWHLAANDPWTFCAIAPSAGWSGFDSYGGGRPDSPWSELWKGADGASGTLALLDNLKQLPTYVLHGVKDDNVPVSEAQRMIDALAKAGAPPQFHLQEGAGHWWDGDAAPGADCVDWPPIFDLFRKTPPRASDDAFAFVTPDPSVTSKCGWVEIVQPIEYGKLASIDVAWDGKARRGRVRTENVRRLALDLPPGREGCPFEIDGTGIEVEPLARKHDFLREGARWRAAAAAPASEKRPARSGPLKRVFDRHFVLIYGSQGTPAERAVSYERARFDAATWWYRANGRVEVVRDDDFLAAPGSWDTFAGDTGAIRCNFILYGNEETNAAWPRLVDGACPIHARRGELVLGAQTFRGANLGAAFVRPLHEFVHERRDADGTTAYVTRPDAEEDDSLVGVFADSGVAGARAGFLLAPFISGVGYPDYTLFSSEIATKGDGGVLAAGWFAHDWTLAAK